MAGGREKPMKDEKVSRHCDRYGQFYWCVGVYESICPSGQIYFHADEVVVEGQSLVSYRKDGSARMSLLSFAPGQWRYFFGASLMDGAAVCVEHWEGEIEEAKR
jgi:hypothetical protein